jgi:hypothetical protein
LDRPTTYVLRDRHDRFVRGLRSPHLAIITN